MVGNLERVIGVEDKVQKDVVVSQLGSKYLAFEDFANVVCPFCGGENVKAVGTTTGDTRFPESSGGNYTIEMQCAVEPHTHKWLVGMVMHQDHTWLVQLNAAG